MVLTESLNPSLSGEDFLAPARLGRRQDHPDHPDHLEDQIDRRDHRQDQIDRRDRRQDRNHQIRLGLDSASPPVVFSVRSSGSC